MVTTNIYADQPFERQLIYYQDDQTTVVDGSTRTVSLNIKGNTVARELILIEPRTRYARVIVTNDSGSNQTFFRAEVRPHATPPTNSQLPLDIPLRDGAIAGLTRSVIVGRQPDGDYVNTPATGVAIETTSTLSADAAFTSSWIDTDGFSTIQIFVDSNVISANQGIQIQFTDDSQAGTPTVRDEVLYTFTQEDIDRGSLQINLQTRLDGFRIIYTNGSTAQTSFYLSATLKVQSDSLFFNDAGALQTSDFLTEVARGNVNGYEIGTVFGRNPEIDTTTDPEDMWNGGGDYTGFPTGSAETVQVFSSSTSDTSAGTGARTIRFFGLKSSTSTDYESEDVTMNGTTAVTTSSTWYRINKAYVLTAGSGGSNAGTITIRHSSTTANVFVQMPVGFNETTIAAYTVPAEKTLLLKRIRTSITRASGAAGSATVTLRVRETGGVFRAIRVFEVQTASTTDFTQLGGDILPAGTDIKFRIDQVSDNDTVAEAAFEYVLTNN